jgi:hypothetical protein
MQLLSVDSDSFICVHSRLSAAPMLRVFVFAPFASFCSMSADPSTARGEGRGEYDDEIVATSMRASHRLSPGPAGAYAGGERGL